MKQWIAVLALVLLAMSSCGGDPDSSRPAAQTSTTPRPAAQTRDARELFRRTPRTPLIHLYPNEAWKRLVALEEEGRTTLSVAEYATAERDLAAVLAHEKRLDDDPAFRELCALANRVRLDASFGGASTQFRWSAPFAVFVEETEDGLPSRGLMEALTTLHKTFRREFGKPLDLPDLAELSTPDRRQLKVYVFADPASFRAYGKRIWDPVGKAVAFYRRTDQWVLASAGQEDALHLLLQTAVHQLVHAYTKAVMERELREEVQWTDPRSASRLCWFQEGLAELLAARKRREDGTLELLVPNTRRIEEWKANREGKLSEWTFEELMEVGGGGDLNRRTMLKGLGRDADRLYSLFHAQAWSFAHYMWTHWRERFLEYMGNELSGRSSPAQFRLLFREGEWKALRIGFESYVEKLLE